MISIYLFPKERDYKYQSFVHEAEFIFSYAFSF